MGATFLGKGGAARLMAIVVTTLMAATTMVIASAPAEAASDSRGTDYWLGFPANYSDSPELTLFISGDTATTGSVEIPGLSFTQAFSVTPGSVTSVPLPAAAQINDYESDSVVAKGIHVTAGAEVSVYGLNRIQYTTDAYLGLPTDILGTSYVVLGWKNVDVVEASEFAVVASEDATTATITPSVTTGAHTAGVAYTVNMDAGDAYLLQNTDAEPADLSGTIVTSDKPVAVFGGHACANIPNGSTQACDHVVEELPPTETWGKSFVTMPLANRVGGDTFRMIASQAGTTVKVNGVAVATLGAGELHEQLIDGPATITADKPILVAQYSNGSGFDGVTSDPFMMLIPPYEQFLASYTVTTPATGFNGNYINLVVPNGAVGSVTVDGVPVAAGDYTAIGSSGFSGVQVPVDLGAHNLDGPLPFGAFMYGYADYDSYGYPGGLSLAPIASVTSVVLSPKTATNPVDSEHCVDATVTDQNGQPLADVRVDFAVTGANPGAGFANTNASGVARYCYTGTNAGSDTITAAVGTLSDTASKTWTQQSEAGSLTITKQFDPLTSGVTRTFPIDWSCDNATSGSVNLAGGQSATIDEIPAGTVCSVTEVKPTGAPAGWYYGAPVVTGSPATITAGSAATVTVQNSIIRHTSSLKITKRVTGAPLGYRASFKVHVACTGDGGTYDRTISYPMPGSVTITGIPTRSKCTVSEPTLPPAPRGQRWLAPTFNGNPTTITLGVTKVVTVTNRLTRW
ncbi:MAG: DUF5979 domain-containing protein [Acidimicrobiia bacterium]